MVTATETAATATAAKGVAGGAKTATTTGHVAAATKAVIATSAVGVISSSTHFTVGGVVLTGPTVSGALVTGTVVGAISGMLFAFLAAGVLKRGLSICDRCQGSTKNPETSAATTGCLVGAAAGATAATGGAILFHCLEHREMVKEGLGGGAVGACIGCTRAVASQDPEGTRYWWC